jgi:hypothetical protein
MRRIREKTKLKKGKYFMAWRKMEKNKRGAGEEEKIRIRRK